MGSHFFPDLVFRLFFGRVRVPGLVPLDWIRTSVLFWGIYASGAPLWCFTDAKPIWGDSLASPLGIIHVRKTQTTIPNIVIPMTLVDFHL